VLTKKHGGCLAVRFNVPRGVVCCCDRAVCGKDWRNIFLPHSYVQNKQRYESWSYSPLGPKFHSYHAARESYCSLSLSHSDLNTFFQWVLKGFCGQHCSAALAIDLFNRTTTNNHRSVKGRHREILWGKGVNDISSVKLPLHLLDRASLILIPN